jgi:DNA processing protein
MEHKARQFAALRMFLVSGLGLRSANALIRHFKDPERVFEANPAEIDALGVPPDVIGHLLSPKSAERARQEWERAAELGISIIDILDPAYPPLLREIYDPPIILYICGKNWDPDLPQVSIVGTRRPTGYGLNCGERLSEDLAKRGIAVTSGLARGIDSTAHRGASRAGVTYAVFGCGLDFVYPRENRTLAQIVREKGAVLSEFPLGTPPAPQNFPIRNRIIAGMALGVVVVEAAEYSGSLITVRLALESNREVFAVPGNITSPKSFGPHMLIRQGAKLVTGWEDVVEELPHPVRDRILAPLLAQMQAAKEPELDAVERQIWRLLSVHEGMPIDSLLVRVPLPTTEIYSAILAKENREVIRQLPGNKYIRRL